MYQPFLKDIGRTLGGAMAQQGQQQLIQAAYMGQPGALEQLYGVNPQAAQSIQREKTAQEQQAVQTQRYEQQQARISEQDKLKAQEDLRKISQNTQKAISSLADDQYDQARSYWEQQVSTNQDLIQAAGVEPEALEFTPEKFKQIKTIHQAATETKDDQVQSSKILPSGVVLKVMKSGNIELYNPEDETREIIEAAELRGTELAGLKTGEREEAKKSAKASAKAYEDLIKSRQNISNLDEGIKLLDEGASTGAIESRWPTIKAASVKLENLKNRLGLDVVGSVTFGALSESELNMALETALPTKLNEPELKKWLQDKKTAQVKLINNLEEAALYLGTPGNTIADFIKMKKDEKGKAGAPPKAGDLKVGDVVSGFRYKGGDPSKQESWESQ